jgi:glutamyl-tRNA reductase
MAWDDIAPVKMGSEVVCSFYTPRNLESLKFLWALVHKTADNSDRWLDKDEAMEDLKMRARFAKFVRDRDGNMTLRPKSLKRINEEQLRLLTEKIMDIIVQEILPGMKRNDLRREIEEMLK